MLELKNLTYTTTDPDGRSHPIIDDITFTFAPDRFYCITGPNGSGKTTLVRLIMGILTPTEGTVRLDGQDLSSFSLTERARRGLAYGFQHPARFKGLTFRDLLRMAAGTDRDEEVVSLMTRVGICSPEVLDKEVDARLSGGEIKKIELATVLARKPRVAIFDEPDTGIDLWTVGPMVELLSGDQRERGTLSMVVSHNEKFLRAADEILLIRQGRLAHVGSLESTLPLLSDLDFCDWTSICEGGRDARCHR